MNLFKLAVSGKHDELKARLRHVTSQIAARHGKMSDDDRLLVDADIAVQKGDFQHATDLLRLRAQPKWSSEAECGAAYGEAMAGKRTKARAA